MLSSTDLRKAVHEVKDPLVSIIVLNHNGRTFLLKCFDSLKKLSYSNYEVIMVDNASTDGSVKYVRSIFPWVKIIQSDFNVGFTGGNNLGCKVASGKYLVFLNNDTFIDSAWLDELVGIMEGHQNVGIAQSLILDYETMKVVQCAGLYLLRECGWTWAFCRNMPWDMFLKRYDFQTIDIFAGFGASIIVQKKLFEEIGGFDDEFFIYSEETDLSWRVRLKGYNVVLASKSLVYHKLGGFMSKTGLRLSEFHRIKNVIRMLLKNYSLHSLFLYFAQAMFMMFSRSLFYLFIKCQNAHFIALIKAISWNLKNLRSTMCYREFVQNEVRLVSDEALEYVMKRLPLSDVLKRIK